MSTPELFALKINGPTLPVNPDYRFQRYFCGGKNSERKVGAKEQTVKPEISVYRNAQNDFAELTVALSSYGTTVEVTIPLNTAQLREIASRLIDAAHDLDVNPSRKLIAEANAEGGAA